MSKTDLDFSSRTVPDSWTEAAGDAPQGTPGPLKPRHKIAVMPNNQKPDVVVGCLTGLAMTVISATAWFVLATDDVDPIRSPLMAVALGALIAIAVRLGAGPGGPDQRATLNVMFYLVSLFAVTYWIERSQYIDLYGIVPTNANVEDALVRDHLSKWRVMGSWGLGLYVTVHLSYILRRRFR